MQKFHQGCTYTGELFLAVVTLCWWRKKTTQIHHPLPPYNPKPHMQRRLSPALLISKHTRVCSHCSTSPTIPIGVPVAPPDLCGLGKSQEAQLTEGNGDLLDGESCFLEGKVKN